MAVKYHASDLLLRPARPEDALCLSVLAMQVFLDTYATEGIRPQLAREVLASYSESSFNEAIADNAGQVEVAEINGHLVGFAQVTFNAHHELAPPGSQAELLRLYVQEPFTGAKLGTKLLHVAERVAQAHGASVLWLTPWSHNTRALAFYSRRGYTDYGLTHFRFEGESHENRVYARQLAPSADLARPEQPATSILRSGGATNLQQGLVVFAKNKRRVSAFYQQSLALEIQESDSSHDLLRGNGHEVVVHTIARKYAAGIKIAKPPEPREETPFKPTFVVASLSDVRRAVEATGGHLKPEAAAWHFRGHIVLDGWDPEGNIVQFKQAE